MSKSMIEPSLQAVKTRHLDKKKYIFNIVYNIFHFFFNDYLLFTQENSNFLRNLL